ncbi:MAG: hypothetical protein RBG13Loki_2224 [Promethearchaeota archaeon CR_4]|nr:MAG: hypothetical protein RBG13Loki_2224 [Candidatus Lokiarchaeota archaeon CR_4]
MELKDSQGVVVAKLSSGKINSAKGDILGRVEKGRVSDAAGKTVGFVKQTTVVDAENAGKALYSDRELSTYSGAAMYKFSGTTVTDYADKAVLRLSEDYSKLVEELVAYIVFFSKLWKDTSKIYTSPAY